MERVRLSSWMGSFRCSSCVSGDERSNLIFGPLALEPGKYRNEQDDRRRCVDLADDVGRVATERLGDENTHKAHHDDETDTHERTNHQIRHNAPFSLLLLQD